MWFKYLMQVYFLNYLHQTLTNKNKRGKLESACDIAFNIEGK